MKIEKMRGFIDPLTIGAVLAFAGTLTALQIHGVPGEENSESSKTVATKTVETVAAAPTAEYDIDRDILYTE